MKDLNGSVQRDGETILSPISFNYDASDQRGAFVVYGGDQFAIEPGGPYRLNFPDGRWAEMLISAITPLATTQGSLVSFVISGELQD